MISKLAKSEIEKMWKDGLNPSYEDIIKLNALGVKLENNSESYNLAAVPRIAFLGDYLITQPTVYKQIWIDKTSQLLKDDFITQLYFTAYALNTPDDELPKFKSIKEIMKSVNDFVKKVLSKYTNTQIIAAVTYAMTGNDPNENEDYTPEEKKEVNDIFTMPDETYSQAQKILAKLLTRGVDSDIQYQYTVPAIERMLINAMIYDGEDILKNEHTQDAAKFYACAGSIRNKLKQTKE